MEYEAYFSELKDIKDSKDSSSEEFNFSTASSEDELSKTPDEGEKELQWLKEAGFADLVSKYTAGTELDEELVDGKMSSLTLAQAAALKRRVDALNSTLRSRRLEPPSATPSVREVFSSPPTQQSTNASSVVDGLVSSKGGKKSSRKHKAAADSHFATDRPLIKSRGSGSGSSLFAGVADTGTEGIQTLSLTHTQPILLPTKSLEDTATHTASSHTASHSHAASQPGEMTSLILEPGQSEARLILQSDTNPNHQSDTNPNHQSDTNPSHQYDLASALPTVQVVRDTLGLTYIDDLGNRDRIRVRALSLMEVSAMLDNHGINLIDGRRRSGKRKPKEGSLFGNSLDILIENDQKKMPCTKTPLLLQQIISYLEKNGLSEEGVLRVSGSASRMKVLRQEMESQFYEGTFRFGDARTTDVAGLLKQFLRELAQPLLTTDYQNGFLSIQSIPGLKQQIQALNLLVLVLPESHRNTLQLLLGFLSKVVDHQQQNKMSLGNVAMIMAPNIYARRPGAKSSLDMADLELANRMSYSVRMLVRYHQQVLWAVPPMMVMQLRHGYQQEANARKLKDSKPSFLGFGKKSKADQKKSSPGNGTSDEGVIRVQAPDFTQIGTSLQLNSTTTAGDIVASFSRHGTGSETSEFQLPVSGDAPQYGPAGSKPTSSLLNGRPTNGSPATKSVLRLYEVGGNIGERCLDNETCMLALVRVNPATKWIIRSSSHQPY